MRDERERKERKTRKIKRWISTEIERKMSHTRQREGSEGFSSGLFLGLVPDSSITGEVVQSCDLRPTASHI